MAASTGSRLRRVKVAHIRFSESEMSAVEDAAEQAGLSISAFVRSLSLEGAGVRPFMSREDQAIMELLLQDVRVVGGNLNMVARALQESRPVVAAALAGAIDDARAAAITISAELATMTQRAGTSRRGEAT